MAATARLPEHSHCRNCDDPLPAGDEFCSEECRDDYRRERARESRGDYLFAAFAVVSVIAIALLTWFVKHGA
ncbi:MAG: DUF2116 family Zn-ribbon domain-containing protein [Candidatus Methanomethylophilaceae archaeon]|jgi:predicted nucleic acid-binding Zn ribbon protein|nr:DUF2116 family Zn-ribbon domain-containing protein [Candidatus Methanomethylophilaceae archaeon]NLF34211.1 DUF2116 family Zn-ribbon domain-containing protein [Thermoplasmatales archaeon]